MKLALLCVCLVSSASASPSFLHYMPHFTGFRQVSPNQVQKAYIPGQSLPQTGVYSVEMIYPNKFAGSVAGVKPVQPLPSHGFIKYSIPQPTGRQSVEVYFPYDFSQQRVLPFEFPPQMITQQISNNSPFDANPPLSQNPTQSVQQDRTPQINQMPATV